MRIHFYIWLVLIMTGFLGSAVFTQAMAANSVQGLNGSIEDNRTIDIYFLYSGTDKDFVNRIVDQLPDNINVKYYNVFMLALADYSGKQKALAKFSQSQVVIVIGKDPYEYVDVSQLKSVLSIPHDMADPERAILQKISNLNK